MSFTRAASLPGDDESCGLLDRLEEFNGEFIRLYFPVGNHGAQDLIDGDVGGDLDFDFARGALSDFQIYFGVDGGCVLAKSQELRQRAAQTQRLSTAMILGLSSPRKGECFAAASESNPLAFRCGFGFLREEASGEPDIHALTRKLYGGARNAGSSQGQSDALFACGGCDRKSDFE